MSEPAKPAALPAQEQLYLGIELGSTRVKAVLVGPDCRPVACGSAEWASSLKDGYWTYSLDAVWHTLQACYAGLAAQVRSVYGEPLKTLGGIGISAMMHGYLAFDAKGRQLVPFRTWQNTSTGPAANELSGLLGCNIPQRWSAAHVYQAMLDGEEHVPRIARLNTLAGYVHEQLTGEFVLGIGDASGMFPVDRAGYDKEKLAAFDMAAERFGVPWKLGDILPPVRRAGERAGRLTARGAALLDTSGALCPGIPLCPPEGDAGTGMVATNSIAPRTGNVSAGTSIFAMVVLEHALHGVYPEVDIVATPEGAPTAMVHCNNCTGEIDAWAAVFMEFAEKAGFSMQKAACYNLLYRAALEADGPPQTCVAYNYLAGEPVAGIEQGRPLVMRMPGMRWGLAEFMRAQLYTACATLRVGMDILTQREHVEMECLTGHGGFFKTPGAGQKVMAAALGVPVAVQATAGEGGPWGMAVLAAYMANRARFCSLQQFLTDAAFQGSEKHVEAPSAAGQEDFEQYLEAWKTGMAVERAAVQHPAAERRKLTDVGDREGVRQS